MFDPQQDPLGLGLMARARARRTQMQNTNPALQGYMSGPLPDDNWDAFFQAVGEESGGKKVNFAGGPSPEVTTPDAEPGVAFAEHSNQFRGYDPYNQLAQASMNKRRKAGR